ncbi:MAG: RES family NAD+ phosphorylase [Proteobacteria bacterium]|nr:RES family NAD+ phosphorylase [Pseudomonadota bacterium]
MLIHQQSGAGGGRCDAVGGAHSQALGAALLTAGSNGVLYRSVRRPAGECIACFRPPLVWTCALLLTTSTSGPVVPHPRYSEAEPSGDGGRWSVTPAGAGSTEAGADPHRSPRSNDVPG